MAAQRGLACWLIGSPDFKCKVLNALHPVHKVKHLFPFSGLYIKSKLIKYGTNIMKIIYAFLFAFIASVKPVASQGCSPYLDEFFSSLVEQMIKQTNPCSQIRVGEL
ncbi:MAG: hypothetical protein NW215_15025 [Hyphomicrobiales bacterium]|nr:hypothetical protein [Hyphomicrobiales bacterium]